MDYKINEIAKILNLSKQMIRYYEQCGVIQPARLEKNNYRVYNTLDYFTLAEAIGLSQFNVNIKDIYNVKAIQYNDAMSKCYRDYIQDIDEELLYKQNMRKRAKELLDRIDLAELNIGITMIKKIPAYRLFPLVQSKDDQYDKISTPEEVRPILNSSKTLPFGDGFFEIGNGIDLWSIGIQKEYLSCLDIPDCDDITDIEEQYCLCKIINMGEIGEFKTEMIQKEIDQLMSLNYIFIGKPKCLLLCRGSVNGEFHRLMEIQIPIKR
ncbi:MAG: MerR family transcriptional regulator [Floccifex porci]|uniref:MerR family transcriptional regulator n=1 Tax=Floccifex porci TaxID=2606629 RepID=UPI0023F48295|nr:MerR family transcriptional regulator [Floccifex porci]MDD7467714.1 MerR family transcriptional regulator [Floccifex porci]MDY4796135.1 MerR family transcriptional regulator [Floccifex porci]